jgi:hypothetical protein
MVSHLINQKNKKIIKILLVLMASEPAKEKLFYLLEISSHRTAADWYMYDIGS